MAASNRRTDERRAASRAFIDKLEEYVRFTLPYYVTEGKSYLTIAIGCTGGRQAARGDVVVQMDADGQHAPHMIPRFLAGWAEGADVVYAMRENRSDEPVSVGVTDGRL